MTEKRDTSEAGQLRRTAFDLERRGRPITAILFRNAAWEIERGMTWLEYCRGSKNGPPVTSMAHARVPAISKQFAANSRHPNLAQSS